MKNLVIFVLALIAISSVCSMKLNKVLKEEKIQSLSPQLEADLKVENLRGKDTRKIETENSVVSESDGPRRKVEAVVSVNNKQACNLTGDNIDAVIVNIPSCDVVEADSCGNKHVKTLKDVAPIMGNDNLKVVSKGKSC